MWRNRVSWPSCMYVYRYEDHTEQQLQLQHRISTSEDRTGNSSEIHACWHVHIAFVCFEFFVILFEILNFSKWGNKLTFYNAVDSAENLVPYDTIQEWCGIITDVFHNWNNTSCAYLLLFLNVNNDPSLTGHLRWEKYLDDRKMLPFYTLYDTAIHNHGLRQNSTLTVV